MIELKNGVPQVQSVGNYTDPECPWCKSTDRAGRLEVACIGVTICYNDWHDALLYPLRRPAVFAYWGAWMLQYARWS
jgi:hypothetical protein